MTDRYVGPGGNDGASGLTWALRKLTLNGVEDTPVVAGDTVYVGAGTYRETLTVDVTGTLGNIITYIADVTGVNTDGVGGEVRITGSDDDKTETRAYGISLTSKDYRTFRGFRIDMCSTACFLASTAWDNLIIEDCVIYPSITTQIGIDIALPSASGETFTIRRCLIQAYGRGIYIRHGSSQYSVTGLIENCVFLQCIDSAVEVLRAYGWTIKNCTFYDCVTDWNILSTGVSSTNNSYVYNCLFVKGRAISASASNTIIEDYSYFVNQIYAGGMLSNVTLGANSVYRNLLESPQFLLDGFYFPQNILEFSRWSPIGSHACGQSPPNEDFYGITRPTVDAKKSRGAVQQHIIERETTTVPSGETESIKMSDADEYQIFIPVTGKSMRFAVKVYREANYTGTLPQMIIKQPGQSDRTTTDTGAVSQFNDLSDSFTPSDTPPYVVMVIRSNNTATSGNFDTYFGGFSVR